MIAIYFRVVDFSKKSEIESMSRSDLGRELVFGYFRFVFGEEYAGGYYHENSIREDEWGDEDLGYWFSSLLRVVDLLSRGEYVAIREIEKMNVWLELQWYGEKIRIRKILANSPKNMEESQRKLLVTSPFTEPSIISHKDAFASWEELKELIVSKSNEYLSALHQIDPILLQSADAQKIAEMLAGQTG